MSVIPWILEGPQRTIVSTDSEFRNGVDGRVVLVQNLEKQQFQERDTGNASYDLRVGLEYRDHRDAGPTQLQDGEGITLQPGAAVIVQTEEYVHFPKHVFGHIVPRVHYLQKGISNTGSKVDPGYKGNLLITLFNLGKQPVYIPRKERICCLYLMDVADGVLPYEKDPKRIQGRSAATSFRQWRDFMERNTALIQSVLILVTLALSALEIFTLLQRR